MSVRVEKFLMLAKIVESCDLNDYVVEIRQLLDCWGFLAHEVVAGLLAVGMMHPSLNQAVANVSHST